MEKTFFKYILTENSMDTIISLEFVFYQKDPQRIHRGSFRKRMKAKCYSFTTFKEPRTSFVLSPVRSIALLVFSCKVVGTLHTLMIA